jgi:curved DNA-binding protein CbpA
MKLCESLILALSICVLCFTFTNSGFTEDLYKTLEVKTTASFPEIRRSFKKLALKYHPDKNKDKKEWAKGMFTKIAHAYEILSDPEKRKKYDKGGIKKVEEHEEKKSQEEHEKNRREAKKSKKEEDENETKSKTNEDEDEEEKTKEKKKEKKENEEKSKKKEEKEKDEKEKEDNDEKNIEDLQENEEKPNEDESEETEETNKKPKEDEDQEEFFYDFDKDQNNGNEEPEKVEYSFENSNVIEIMMNNISRLYQRKNIWFILFYNSNSITNTLGEIWKQFAEKTKDLFTTGSVNCDKEGEICDEFGIKTTQLPLITYLKEDGNVLSEIYKGEIDLDNIIKYAKSKIPSNIIPINTININSFLLNDPFSQKVLIFIQGRKSPKILRSLSLQFKDKLKFGEVNRQEKDILKKYGVTKFPTIIVARDDENWVTFYGQINKESLTKLFYQFTHKKRNSSEIKQFTSDVYLKEKMCNSVDGKNICVLFVNKNNVLTDETKSLLEKLASRYVNDPLKFLYSNLITIKNFNSVFLKKDIEFNVFVIRGKRNKYCSYTGKYDFQEIINFLDKILSGGGTYKPLKENFKLRDVKMDL